MKTVVYKDRSARLVKAVILRTARWEKRALKNGTCYAHEKPMIAMRWPHWGNVVMDNECWDCIVEKHEDEAWKEKAEREYVPTPGFNEFIEAMARIRGGLRMGGLGYTEAKELEMVGEGPFYERTARLIGEPSDF